MNIQVQALSENAVNISWSKLRNPEIVQYIVYYKPTADMTSMEESANIPSENISIIVEGLMEDAEYQFQVAAVAVISEQEFIGLKSATVIFTLPSSNLPQFSEG